MENERNATARARRPAGERGRTALRGRHLAAVAIGGALLLAVSAAAYDGGAEDSKPGSSLEETRLAMTKWIETQQILSKERNDWQQGKEVLVGRIELLEKEIAGLGEKLDQARAGAEKAAAERAELDAENSDLETLGIQLSAQVTVMEAEIRRLYPTIPEPLQTKLMPLRQRVSDEPGNTRASIAERYQNVLGILNELNKANNELTVTYEVRTLADGKPAEVRVLYVGLAQAYYLSAAGEGGIGRPTREGWTWEPAPEIADELSIAFDVLQGKHAPAFVPLPVKMR